MVPKGPQMVSKGPQQLPLTTNILPNGPYIPQFWLPQTPKHQFYIQYGPKLLRTQPPDTQISKWGPAAEASAFRYFRTKTDVVGKV